MKIDFKDPKTKKVSIIAVSTLLVLLLATLYVSRDKNDVTKEIAPTAEKSAEQKTAEEAISKMFGAQVIAVKPLSKDPNGLVAWVVKADSGANFVYTSGFKTDVVTFGGAALDSANKENLTLKFLTPFLANANQSTGNTTSANAQPPQDVGQTPYMEGEFKGEIPDSIKAINNLKGVTYGKASVDKTLFVLFDPRCPYCKQTFKQQQKYIDKGYAFKWIPVLALGQNPMVANQIQTMFSAKDPQAELTQMMSGNPNPTQINAEQDTLKILADNQSFLTSVFQVNGGTAGVPTAFFINHKTGKAQMLQGVSETYILNNIFGE